MVKSDRPPANAFVAGVRRIYNPIGFSKGYNAILAFITLGAMFGFSLSRSTYFSYYGVFCNPEVIAQGKASAPGECYYYLQNPYKIGMMLHIFCILPAGICVCLQFIPVIRHKAIIVHRINGYLVILLSSIASAGAIIVTPHAQGGDMATRTVAGALVISTTVSYIIAYINIKRLQIDQHRAWMLRAWAYFSVIITLRLIQIIYVQIISGWKNMQQARACAQIDFLFQSEGYTTSLYPDCAAFYNGTDPDRYVMVNADFFSDNPMEISSSFGVGFGAAGWLALWIHAILVELYLRLTPTENERLKEVSYQRQKERGFRNPGTAGLSAQKLGDASPYVPVSHRRVADGPEELEELAKHHRSSYSHGS